MFLLVPVHPSSPGQTKGHKTVVVVVVYANFDCLIFFIIYHLHSASQMTWWQFLFL